MKYENKRLMGFLMLLVLSGCGPAIDPPKDESKDGATSGITDSGAQKKEETNGGSDASLVVVTGDQTTAENSIKRIALLEANAAVLGYAVKCDELAKDAPKGTQPVCHLPDQATLNNLLKEENLENLKKLAPHARALAEAYKIHLERFPQDVNSPKVKERLEYLNAGLLNPAKESHPDLFVDTAAADDEAAKLIETKPVDNASYTPSSKPTSVPEESVLPSEPVDVKVNVNPDHLVQPSLPEEKSEVKEVKGKQEGEQKLEQKDLSSNLNSDLVAPSVAPSSEVKKEEVVNKDSKAPVVESSESKNGSVVEPSTEVVDHHSTRDKSLSYVLSIETDLAKLGYRLVKQDAKSKEKKCQRKGRAHFHSDSKALEEAAKLDPSAPRNIAQKLIAYEAALTENLNRYGASILADDFRLKLEEVRLGLENSRKNHPELFIESSDANKDAKKN